MKDPRIPAAEMDVLACLNRMGEATAAQIREAMRPHRPMAHGAVATLLKRLESKKLVRREKGPVGKAFVYSLVQKRGAPFRSVLRDLVRRIFHNDSAALVASLFETKPPTAAEVEKIQEMLNELRNPVAKKSEEKK